MCYYGLPTCLASWCSSVSNDEVVIYNFIYYILSSSCNPANDTVLLSTLNEYTGGPSFYL